MSDLYVASDLVWFVAPTDHALAPDMGQADADQFRAYRRLDLAWFGYLAAKMEKLRWMDEAGEIAPQQWALMRSRWFVIVAHALAAFGPEAMERAAITPPDDRYQIPMVRKGSDLLPKVAAAALPEPRTTARRDRGAQNSTGVGPTQAPPTSRESGHTYARKF